MDKQIEADDKEHQSQDKGHAGIGGGNLHFLIGFFAR